MHTNFKELSREEAPRVILFDLWRTLYLSLDKEPIKDLQGIFSHNMQVEGGHWEPELDPEFLRLCLSTNIPDLEKFLRFVADQYGYQVPPQAVQEFQRILDRERFGLARYKDVDPTIAVLKAKGYRLGVISNLWPFPNDSIFDGSFASNFEHIIRSYEVGHPKPDQEIFNEAAKRFQVEPTECLMVGDHPKADIEGALKAGMHAALIDRPGEFCHLQIPGVRVMRSLTELLELPSLVSPNDV